MTELPIPEWALTLTQPWATLVAIQAKLVETRSWGTHFRGTIAIHAAKGFPSEAKQLCYEEPFRSVLRGIGVESFAQLPTAQILATTELFRCDRFDARAGEWIRKYGEQGRLPKHEADFGDYAEGRYGFFLRNTIALPEPVTARGMLNLWRIPADVRAALGAQLKAA